MARVAPIFSGQQITEPCMLSLLLWATRGGPWYVQELKEFILHLTVLGWGGGVRGVNLEARNG